MRPSAFAALAPFALACSIDAQITVRDTILPLAPISICQDGATHYTVCTRYRLRPPRGGSLSQYVGQPLEITGVPGAVTCQFVDVTSVVPLGVHQLTTTSSSTTSLSVSFAGVGAATDGFFLFFDFRLRTAPLSIPGITGPIHLDPATMIYLGTYQPAGAGAPFLTVTVPNLPQYQGVRFFDQTLVLHAGGALEMTNVDCFQF
jgi:hypothetical protein